MEWAQRPLTSSYDLDLELLSRVPEILAFAHTLIETDMFKNQIKGFEDMKRTPILYMHPLTLFMDRMKKHCYHLDQF